MNITAAFLAISKKIDISNSPIYHSYMMIQPFIMLFFTVSIVMIAKNSGWKA
jgi:hypothetical protein